MASTDKATAGVGVRWTRTATPRAVLLLALLAGLAAASGARLGAAPASTPRLDWLFDAPVTSAARVGDRLYLGGDFTLAAPRRASLGTLAAFSKATGDVVPGWPRLDGAIDAIEPDGGGGYYLAGAFTNAGAGGLAHIRADGTVDPAFAPQITLPNNNAKLALVGASLVVVDDFMVPQALDPVTGATLPWSPVLPTDKAYAVAAGAGRVFVMTIDAPGSRRVTAFDGASGTAIWTSAVLGANEFRGAPSGALVVSGSRLLVATSKLYALDTATGAIDPSWGGSTQESSWQVYTMQVSGTVVYLGGSFASVRGQMRKNLAAVDLATGDVLPWNPDASDRVTAMAVMADGTVFAAASTVGGVKRGAVTRIDPGGSAASWTPHALFDAPQALTISPAGDVVVGAFEQMLPSATAVSRLAAFDLGTETLVPGTPVVTGGGVLDLASRGNTVFIAGSFSALNGQPRPGLAAVDGLTGAVLAWPAPGAVGPPDRVRIRFVSGPWVYVQFVLSRPIFRRIDATTGVLDPVWAFGGNFDAIDTRSDGAVLGLRHASFPPTFASGVLDPVTGAFTERSRFPYNEPDVSARTIDGDTLYLLDPPWSSARQNPTILRAFDLATGRAVQVPAVTGELTGVTIADGRLFVVGNAFTVSGTPRSGLVELARPGALTGWEATQPAIGVTSFYNNTGARDGILFSTFLEGARYRLRVFDLGGPSAPSGLRAQTQGPNTVFTWDGMATPPPGGYVIEGGFAAGQTAGALPVGNVTSVALPMPAGPVFIRVRAPGSGETSNEIVAGCFAPPLPPTALVTTLNGTTLTLSWTAPAGAVTTYTLLAGTASGLSDAATVSLGPVTSVGGQVPGGTFFARVTASNACGTSGPGGEVFFTIGAADPLPVAPTNLTSSVTGSTLTLSWTAPAGPVTGYVLEAGSGPGLANIGAATIGPAPSFVIPGVPAGVYYVRARAVTSAGSGAPSSDVVVTVP